MKTRMRLTLWCFLIISWAASFFADGAGSAGAARAASKSVPGGERRAVAIEDLGQVAWEVKLGSHQYTIPTVDQGRVFVGSNDFGLEDRRFESTGGGILACLDEKTGETIWRLVIPRFVYSEHPGHYFNHWKCGVCSGPVTEADRIYIVSGRGEVLCLDREGQANGNAGPFVDELRYMGAAPGSDGRLTAQDGDIVWRYDMVAELPVYPHDVCGSTVLVHGDLVYAVTSTGVDQTHTKVTDPASPSLIALEKRTGRLVATDGERVAERMLHGQWSSPVLAEVDNRALILFGAGDGVLYAFEPAGPRGKDAPVGTLKKVWAHDCNPPEYRERDGRRIPYATWRDKSPDGPSEIIGIPVVCGKRIYIAIGQSPISGPGQGMLSCLDAATGGEIWSSKLVGRTLSTAAVADGLLYIPDYSGNLHCFDAESGERLWVHEMGAGAWCSSACVADGKVYVSTEEKVFWVLRAGREKEVLAQARLRAMAITPTEHSGTLYVPTQNRLYAMRVSSEHLAALAR